MNIAINFKNKSIVVDGYSCLCEDINKLEDDWVSLEIDPVYGIRLYRVGIVDTLEDISFIDLWVSFALNSKEKFENLIVEQKKQRLNDLNQVELNEINTENNKLKYESDYKIYLANFAQAEEVERERILRIKKMEGIDNGNN